VKVLATACPDCITNFKDSRLVLDDETKIVYQAIQENEVTE